MIHNKLGTTNLNISAVGIGTWQLSGEWGKRFTQNEVYEMLKVAESLGVNFIDTAECYGDHLSEKFVGQFLKRSNRYNWVIATKFGHKYNNFLDVEDRWSLREVKQQLEDSLIALDTEFVDIYQFHSGNNEVFDDDKLWQGLKKEKDAGKIRYLGLSISEELVSSNDLFQIKKAEEFGINIIQVRYNALHREAEEAIIPRCSGFGIGIIARQPLAYGYLSGKYNIDSVFPKDDVRHWQNRDVFLDTIKAVNGLKKEFGEVDLAQWSIGWCLRNQSVDSVIVGCKTTDQIRNGVEAVKIYANKHQTI